MIEKILNDINKHLEIIIHPTEKCNLDCLYCYEEFNIGKMKPDILIALKKYLDCRVPELNHISIGWFGGEPLLNYDIILNVMEHINLIKINQNKGLNVISNITTNATLLTPDKLNNLVNLGVDTYQVSFDGDKEEHDKLRVTKNHNPTFNIIWENLIQAHKTNLNFDMSLRIHVNEKNESSITKLLRRISSEFGKDERFNVYIRELSRLGGKNDMLLPIIKNNESIERLKTFARDMKLKIKMLDDSYICYAAKPNSFVFRADGTISKCTVALYSDLNIVGRLNSDGTLSLNNEKFTLWTRGLFTDNKQDLSCPLTTLSNDYDMLRTSTTKKIKLPILN